MMCSMLESAAYNIRDTDDLLNPVGAGCLTGVIYKITSVRQPRAPQRLGIRFQPHPHTESWKLAPAPCAREFD